MVKEEEECDEVVREMDVYLTESMGGESALACSLLQFPLRPVYTDIPVIEDCLYKPVNKVMQFEVVSANDVMSISQLHSSALIAPSSNLCCGVIRDNALHITPLDNVFQIRPSFENVTFDTDVVEAPLKEKAEANISVQQVHVKPKESERTRAMKEQSYAYLKKRMDEESFQPLHVSPVDSEDSIASLSRFYYTKVEP